MRTKSHSLPKPSTFLAVESLSRRAHFGRDVLKMSDTALLDDLHGHNSKSPHPLPASFVDALVDAVTLVAA